MAKVSLVTGTTSYIARVFIQDSSSSTGAGKTGLTSGSTGLTCYAARDDDGNAGGTAISLSGGTRGTYSSGGFVEKDATHMPGVYELGIPTATLAAGSKSVLIYLQASASVNMAPCPLEIELTAVNNQSTGFGLSNASANVAQWSGSNVSAATAGIPDVNVKNINNLTGSGITTIKAVQGLTTADTIATYTGNTPQTGDAYARIGAPTGASIAADIQEIEAETDTLLAGVTVTTNNDKTGYALTSGERNSVADALLDRDMSVGTDSGSTTVRTPRQALRASRNKWSIGGGTLTVTKEDDATASWTAAVTQTAGNPVSSIDPAGP